MRFGLDEDEDASSSGGSDADTAHSPHPPPPPPVHHHNRPTRRIPLRARPPAPPPPPNAKPYSPAPVHLVAQPRLPTTRGRGRVLSLSPGSSSDEDLSSDSDSDDDGDGDDSEEDEWPVGPVGSVGLAGWRRDKGKGKALDQGAVHGDPDILDLWDEKQRASSWANANRTFHLSLARAQSASPTAPSRGAASDVSSIQSLLSSLALQQSTAHAKIVAGFETRNRDLWASIEQSIREAEKEEGDRQRLLEENRRRGEEAERKAREMREAAVRKAKEEEEDQRRQRAEADAAKLKQLQEAADKAKEDAAREKEAEGLAKSLGLVGEGSPRGEFERWTAKMNEIKTNVLPVVSSNPAYRKACFAAKRSITPKIGQLTPSASATATIIDQLHTLLASLRPPPDQPTATQPYTWALNHMSKALVKQAEQEVTAKVDTAYPLGRVVIGLLARGHTELGDVLMARLVKKCFWITGWWPAKRPGQTDEDHQKTLGHAPPSASESLVQYATRMSGLVALYAAILQTSPLAPPQGPCPPTSLPNIPPHFRPSAGWRWLVLILRPPLVTLEPTPLLLGTFLEVAGESLLEVYGKQMAKLLEVLLREGVRDRKAGFSDKAKSSTVKLALWLEDWERGKLETPAGRKPDP